MANQQFSSSSSLSAWRRFLIGVMNNRFLRLLGSVIAVLLALGLAMDWIFMPLYTRHGQEVEIPDITKMRYEDAKSALENAGFAIVKEEERFSDEFPFGIVLEQSPAPFAKVKYGRRVHVVTSRGEKRIQVPDLIGRSQREAELLLNQARLVLGAVGYDYSNIHPEGAVSWQSVPPRAEVALNTKVNITLSVGAEPEVFVVPELEGRTLTDALLKIKQAGLRIGQLTYTIVPDLLPETVIRQSLPSNTNVIKGATIDLEISTLPGRNE